MDDHTKDSGHTDGWALHQDGHPTRLLIAGVDDAAREQLSGIAGAHAELAYVSAAGEAHAAMVEKRPAAVLCGLDLPPGSGMDFFRELRGEPQTKRLPFLLLGEPSSKQDWEDLLGDPLADFVRLPLSAPEIGARLQRQLNFGRDLEKISSVAALEHSSDAFYQLDAEGRFVALNGRAEQILQRSREDLLGKVARDEFCELLDTELRVGLHPALCGRSEHEVEYSEPISGRTYEVRVYPSDDGGLLGYFRDLSESLKLQLTAQENGERLRQIIESARDFAIFAMNVEGKITYWNSGAERLFGYEELEVAGKSFSLIFTPEDVAAGIPEHEIQRSLQVGRCEDERWHLRKSGARFFASGMTRAMHDDAGNITGIIKVAQDITQRKNMEERLHEQSWELQERDRQKDEFLSMLAHELRNPLAAVKNAASLMRMSNATEDRALVAGVIERQAKQISQLIDDLMDVSRINSGRINLRIEEVDIAPLLDAAADEVRQQIQGRRHELTCEYERGVLMALADPSRVQQIVVNMLTNASKYTEPGGRIWLTAVQEGTEIVITVRDNGIGLAAERLPQMFELFVQGERSPARSDVNLSMGLTIVKKLTEMHGGRVEARASDEGDGKMFISRLPAVPAYIEEEPPPDSVHMKDRRVLVVDDNVDSARGLARLLKLNGYQVEMAHNGLTGVERAREFRPHVVLLDIGMPGLDGYEVACILRGENCGENALLIALSGYGQEEDRTRSREAGFDHHLVKPIDFEDVRPILEMERGQDSEPGGV